MPIFAMALIFLPYLAQKARADAAADVRLKELFLEGPGLRSDQKKAIENGEIAISLLPQGGEAVGVNADQMFCSASMGKWSCVLAALHSIKDGKLVFENSLELSNGQKNQKYFVTRGDLVAALHFSDNDAAYRVCVAANMAQGGSFNPCYSNELMEELGLYSSQTRKGVSNQNLYQGGGKRCAGTNALPVEGFGVQTTNLGTATSFSKLMSEVEKVVAKLSADQPAIAWRSVLEFNKNRKTERCGGNPGGGNCDYPGTPALGRLVKSYCPAGTSECPIQFRKSGSYPPSGSGCFNDSVWIKKDGKSYGLTVMCNSKNKALCNQAGEIYQPVFDAARAAAEKYLATKSGANSSPQLVPQAVPPPQAQ